MELTDFFMLHSEVALAFSGGVDSAFLLHMAKKLAVRVRAYYVRSAFQPQFELDDAVRLAHSLGADMQVIELDVLSSPAVTANRPDRCYHCKRIIFSAIKSHALADGFDTVIDGTNASDDAGDRPGMRALRELSILSPLRECGLTKDRIRQLSRKAGLFTWDKPAYACLATRIPSGTEITHEMLERTERAENYLSSLGFSDFRVRQLNDNARLQLREDQLGLLLANRQAIFEQLKKYYSGVLLDLEARDE